MNYTPFIPARKAPPPPGHSKKKSASPSRKKSHTGTEMHVKENTDKNKPNSSINLADSKKCSNASFHRELEKSVDQGTQKKSKPNKSDSSLDAGNSLACNNGLASPDSLPINSSSSSLHHHPPLQQPEYQLCGYLGKLSPQQKAMSQFFSSKAGKSLVRQRWMVFSERSCKLFYYKSKGDSDILGEINIAGATLNYEPEEPTGLFNIISDGQTHHLAAGDDANRQRWLEGLQEAKLQYIRTAQDGGQDTSHRIQWYTELPSTASLQGNTNQLKSFTKSSPVGSAYSAGTTPTDPSAARPFHQLVQGLRGAPPSPPSTKEGNHKPLLRTYSHESIPTNHEATPLKATKSAPKPTRPTSIQLSSATDHFNNNSTRSNRVQLTNIISIPSYCGTVDPTLQNASDPVMTTRQSGKIVSPSSTNQETTNETSRNSMNKNLAGTSSSHFVRSTSKSSSFKLSRRPFKSSSTSPDGPRPSTAAWRHSSSSSSSTSNAAAPAPQRSTPKVLSPGAESMAGLKQIGADLMASLTRCSGGRNKCSSSGSVMSEDWVPDNGCLSCKQLHGLLESLEEKLDTRTEELAAAKEGIALLQQDIALLQREQETRSSLDQGGGHVSDEHLLAILREKDRNLVEHEHKDCLQKNEIAELEQQRQQHLQQIELLDTLVKAKDNAIRSITNELEELKARYSLNSTAIYNSAKVRRSNSLFTSSDHRALHQLKEQVSDTSPVLSSLNSSVDSYSSAVDACPAPEAAADSSIVNSWVKTAVANEVSSVQFTKSSGVSPAAPLEGDPTAAAVSGSIHGGASTDISINLSSRNTPKICPLLPEGERTSSTGASDSHHPLPVLQNGSLSKSSIVSNDVDLNSGISEPTSSHVNSSFYIGDILADRQSGVCKPQGGDLDHCPNKLNGGTSASTNASRLDDHSMDDVFAAPSSTSNLTTAKPLDKRNVNSSNDSGCGCTVTAPAVVPSSSISAECSTTPSTSTAPCSSQPKNIVVSYSTSAALPVTQSNSPDGTSPGAGDHVAFVPYEETHQHALEALNIATRERDRFMESYRAYKNQNAFLHKQIIEMSQASDMMKQREERLKYESSVWEAQFDRVRSKYLVLLNDLHSPPSQQHDKDTLARMLSDALNQPPDIRALCTNGKSYDECGFCISASDEDSLQRCATFLSRQAQTTVKDEHLEVKQTESAWEAVLAGVGGTKDPALQLPVLKNLIRERGVPMQYRTKVWMLLIESHIGNIRRQRPDTYYEDLLARCIIRAEDDGGLSSEVDSKTKKQIELDLLRTLPNNRYYETEFADNVIRLRRVLLAFAVHNKEISYCQGLNRLAAIALLFLPEREAFWCLVCVVEHLMPEQYFTPKLLGPQIDQRVLLVLIAEKLPALHHHLSRHRIDISMITFNWFLCLFVEEVPHAIYLHIWDSFLLQGAKVMFRYALAMLKLCEEGIQERTEFMEVSNYLRSVPPSLGDIARLRQTAFHWANPLRRRQLRKLRTLHKEEVLSEVAEQEVLRQQYQLKMAASAAPTAAQLLEQDDDDEQEELAGEEQQEKNGNCGEELNQEKQIDVAGDGKEKNELVDKTRDGEKMNPKIINEENTGVENQQNNLEAAAATAVELKSSAGDKNQQLASAAAVTVVGAGNETNTLVNGNKTAGLNEQNSSLAAALTDQRGPNVDTRLQP